APGRGLAVRFWTDVLPHRGSARRERLRAVLLSPEAREPPRSAPLERRLPARSGCPWYSPRNDPRHGADPDDPRRVRDRRDPAGAARPIRRAHLRALG